MKQWFYSESGEQRGPLEEMEIKQLFDSGRITTSTLVWAEGMTKWTPAGSIPEFTPSPYAPPLSNPLSDLEWSDYAPSGSQVRPWVRYWARYLDFLAFCLILGALLEFAAPQLLEIPDALFGMVVLAVYLFVEPAMFAAWGTTPVKALLRVRVRNQDGSKLSYAQAFRRTLKVWIRGEGLGIPLVSLITHITSYNRLSNHGITSWDAEGALTVSHQQIAWWRWVILLLLIVAFVGLVVLGSEAFAE